MLSILMDSGTKQIEFLQAVGFINNPVDIFFLEEKNSQSLTKLENMSGWEQDQ